MNDIENKTPTLPGDEQGRSWVQANWQDENDSALAQRVLGTLISTDEDNELAILGSAFVVLAADETALCLGAAHSFDEVKKLQRSRSARGFTGVAADFLPRETEYVEVGKVQIFFLVDGEPMACSIGQYNAIGGYDVAAFTAHAPDGRKPFEHHFGLDISEPRVGDEVAVVAHDLGVERQPPQEDGLPRGVISRSLSLRVRVVTEVVRRPTGLPGQSSVFRTTIPVTGGMSGSPIIVNKGGKLVAKGVVSTDLSEELAFTSFVTPGRSTASLLWPAMGLAVNAANSSSSPKAMFPGDLLNQGALDNRSDRVTVQVTQTDGQTQVLYVDERTDPPQRTLLTTTGHPEMMSRGS